MKAVIHRISLTGSQGTGKSTLARAIADRLLAAGHEVALYGGLGDEVAGGASPPAPSPARRSVRAFVRLHLAREAAASGAVQIFDRCLLDTLAYAHVLAVPATGRA